MLRRSRRGAIAAAVASLVAFAAPATGAGATRSCGGRHARVLAANPQLSVVRITKHTPRGPAYPVLYACVQRRARSYVLADANPEFDPVRATRFVLAGRYVAVATVNPSSDQTERFARVRVLDSANGRFTEDDAISPLVDPSDETVSALVLSRSGAAAWIAVNRAPSASNAGVYEVWLQPSHRRARRAEASTGVRPGSLGLSANGRTVYWTDAGGVRSAPTG
jgi:hypothetical protein